MRTRPARQLDLTDSFLPTAPANEFLDRLDALVDWRPIRRELEGLFTATTGRLPQPPLAVFKMLLLQNFYGLSDPQCEALVRDRLSWRKFTGLALTDRVPDETTRVRFRQRLIEHGLHRQLLALVNEQLAAQGLIVREVTLVDATLVQAARRAPAKGASGGGDADADDTVKAGQPHYGYKAPVAADRQHTLIRKADLSAASVHDRQRFEAVVAGDEQVVIADKAYDRESRSQWLQRRKVVNGILRRARRGQRLSQTDQLMNRALSAIRSGIEKIFGPWKRNLGYRRVRYVGWARNRLELEFKGVVWNLKRWVNVSAA
ncbi:MAG TPA: IS5 family transposase [Verrucomicrobiota bacterium]|nr:IS5 family transposase [Verrucomicrobiota bacterium]